MLKVSQDCRLRARLDPELLRYVGQTMPAERLGRIFIQHVTLCTRGTEDITGLVMKWLFRLADDDSSAAIAAAVYVRHAIDSDDVVIQEVHDGTAERLLDDATSELDGPDEDTVLGDGES
ncbi:MAG: hypothetical protein ACR2OO_02260 [Thermomicrobiales bacterium]